MRKLFTQMLRATLLLFVILAYSQADAQKRYAPLASTDYNYTINNDAQVTDRIFEFDLYLKDTDAGQPFEMSIIQAGIYINDAIRNGGTLTPSIVSGSSELVDLQKPTVISWVTGTPNGILRMAAKVAPGCGNGTVIGTTGLGTRVCRIRVTNSVAFAQASPNLTFCFTTSPYPTKVFQYTGSPCTSIQLTSDATNCFSQATNFILNAVPTVTTTAATAVTQTSATLNGTINANSVSTTSSFEWGLTTSYGNTLAGVPLTVTGTTVTPVSAGISGLLPNTTYHYRCKGTYGASSVVNGSDMTFTTASPAPTVVTTSATGITTTLATLNGTVNANGATATVSFQWGLTTSYGNTAPGVPATVPGSSVTPCSANLTGLTLNTTYHFRIVATNSGGTSYGDDMTFTTDASAPVLSTVVTTAATSITPTAAQLNGTVNANGTATTVSFEYGTTVAYGSTISGVPLTVSGSTVTAVLANISGLTPSTLYHFRCVGVNAAGTTNGNDMTFTTPAITLPTVVTNAATSITTTTATLNGTVTANGASTAVTFEYGLTTSYGSGPIAATPSPVTGVTPTAVLANISGLLPNTLYHFRCIGVNTSGTAYGLDMTFSTPCPPAGQAGPITGPTQVCQGGSGYVYTVTIPYATGYIWTVPVGGTITSGLNTNTITVSYAQNAVSGYIFVYGTSACGSGPPSQLGVAMNAPANPVISGPETACVGTPGNVYTTQNGMTNYIWTVSPGGLITAGGGTTHSSVTVTWQTAGPKTVSVNYTNVSGCAGLGPDVFDVTAYAVPVPTITGPSTACTDYPTVYTTETGMTNYLWIITGGGTVVSGQGTSSVTVNWTTTGAKTVTVNYVNENGCSGNNWTVKNVTVNSGAAPTITGITHSCINVGYITYTTQAGMTGYNWTVSPGGIINFGAGTNSILVTWIGSGAQWVRVSYTNAGGCSPYAPTQLDVTIDPLPDEAGEITGPTELCGGATGVMYQTDPIQNAQSYVWSVPAGATIVAGSGTTMITVDFSDDAAPGDITVYGNNVCGNGLVSPALSVMVTPIPPAPVVTPDEPVIGDTLFSSAPEGNQWYFNGDPILGATDSYYVPTEIGAYWVIVSIGGCASDESNHVDVIIGVNDLRVTDFQIYPIPNDGKFNVSVFSPANDTYTITVYNNLGAKIYESGSFDVKGTVTKVVDLKPIAQGIYSVVLRNGTSHVEKKVVVNK